MRSTRVLIGLGALLGIACGEDQPQDPVQAADAAAGSSGSAGTSGNAGSSPGGTPSDGGGSSGTGASSGSGGSSGTGASSGSGGALGANASPRAACRHYVESACRRILECNEAVLEVSCLGALDACPDVFFSPGSTRTVASLIACAAQWATFDCTQAAFGGSPPCATAGTRQVGESCLFASQCQSQRCSALPDLASCGTCRAPVPDGSPCTEIAECALGHVCAAGVCSAPPAATPRQPPAAAGAPCTRSCVEGYVCGPVGATELRCLPLPSPGSPCILDRCRADAYCNTARQCVALPGAGQPCGSALSGGPACAPETLCMANASNNRVCTPRISIGTACGYSDSCVEGGACLMASTASPNQCLRIREEGESCSDAYDRCTNGTACTAGRCVASGNLGVFESRCL